MVTNNKYSKPNKKQLWWLTGSLLGLLVIGLVYMVVKKTQLQKIITPDPAFAAYVSGYTGGTISKTREIYIRLAIAPEKEITKGDPLPSGLLDFQPSIKGKAYWRDSRTIAFTPDEEMKSGKIYKGSLELGKIVKVSNKKFEQFDFGFQIIPQSFEVVPSGLVASAENGLKEYTYKGKIITADAADNNKIEQILKAKFKGQDLKIAWQHIAPTEHVFLIKGLTREANVGNLKLSWSGNSIGLSKKGEMDIPIPQTGEFVLLNAKVDQGVKQPLHLLFSDPLNEGQSLQGLIKIDTLQNFDFSVKGNELIVFPKTQREGSLIVSIFQGIKNIENKAMARDTSFQVVFEKPRPGIRFVKEGNILPSTNGMVLPFEALGLKSVLVRVIKIRQDRLGQFLQVNDLDGSSQLNRVGRPVMQKLIQLNDKGVQDLNQWNRFTLELSKLIKTEPGAVYQIALAFTPADLVNNCGLEERGDGLTKVADTREEINKSAFDHGGGYYFSDPFGNYYGDNYDWSKRDDPCNSAFYSGDKNVIKQNILATDIGLLAKMGSDKKLLVIATDLRTAKPMQSVRLHIYNYQLEEIATTSTDKEGMAYINLEEKPFLIEATHDKQWSYLKVNEGSALSLSQFDVSSGHKIQKGIKGFIFGDRGVWRPGDSLYLTFMLEDKNQNLPDNHPIIFELTDPNGRMVERRVATTSVKGMYAYKTATSPDAPTGRWTATVKVGDESFVKGLRIETVKPNRLKIDLSFPNGILSPENQTGDLHARWLSGAIAGNLKAKYNLILSSTHTQIKDYKSYEFDDPLNSFSSDERTVFEGQLDAQGNAKVNPAIHLDKHAPATLNAYFNGKVYEPGGGFSVNYKMLKYLPYKTYIGIKIPEGSGYGGMLDLDKNYQVGVVSVDSGGRPVNKENLEVSVYKVEWRWWWQSDNNDDADFVNSKHNNKVFETTVTTKNGKGSFPLRVSSPNWGRYYIRVMDKETGYTTGSFVSFEWPYYAGSQVEGMPGGATRLTFSTDKQTYKPGDSIKLFIPGSASGNILISIENGSGVLKTFWEKEKAGTNVFSIPVTREMAPNIYLNVSEIQPHGQTINDLPIRQYGIVGVKVEDPETVLHPVITMPNELQPGENVHIKVKENQGKPMAYTIAVVDEGLLDLTNFKTPDPHSVFYAKEALGVNTWDVFDQVIGAYGGQLERLFSIGGGGEVTQKAETHQLRFKPVVEFFGPFFLNKGASAEHSFIMPEYVGEVRVMVVSGYEGAYGSTDKSVLVKKTLMILPDLPRVAGPDEDILLPVNVFAMKPGVKDVSISVSGDQYFEVKGGNTKTVHFDKPGNSVVFFNLHVASKEGTGQIKVSASGNGYHAKSTTNLTVRNPNPPETRIISKALKPGETWSPDIAFFGMKGTNSAMLEVAGVPSLNLEKRLRYLIHYPFGCLEQRVSAAFPQLFLSRLMTLSEDQKKNTTENVTAVLKAMSQFQHSSGGFTYWPGGNYSDDWVTSYAGNFMIEASRQGYEVLPGMMDHWVSFQTSRANAWQPQPQHHDELMQAYRLYTLALAKHPNWAAMNRMHGLSQIGLQARWRLAAAYTIAGRKDVAEQIIKNVTTDIPDYREMSYTYGSSLRDKAMILQTLVEMGQQEEGYLLAKSIAASLNGKEWLSTQETAFSLIALSQFYSLQKGVSGVEYSYKESGKTAKVVKSDKTLSHVELNLKEANPAISITNKSEGILYVNALIRGTPIAGNEITSAHSLNMQVKYTDMKGQPINPDVLKQGQDFIAEVTLSNPGMRGNYKNVALTQLFPSGWEIRNTRFEGTSHFFEASIPDYQDIRDDRVYTYFDLPAGKKMTFRVLLSASFAGRFYFPGIKCAAMYDETISATQKGGWVEVKREEP